MEILFGEEIGSQLGHVVVSDEASKVDEENDYGPDEVSVEEESVEQIADAVDQRYLDRMEAKVISKSATPACLGELAETIV